MLHTLYFERHRVLNLPGQDPDLTYWSRVRYDAIAPLYDLELAFVDGKERQEQNMLLSDAFMLVQTLAEIALLRAEEGVSQVKVAVRKKDRGASWRVLTAYTLRQEVASYQRILRRMIEANGKKATPADLERLEADRKAVNAEAPKLEILEEALALATRLGLLPKDEPELSPEEVVAQAEADLAPLSESMPELAAALKIEGKPADLPTLEVAGPVGLEHAEPLNLTEAERAALPMVLAVDESTGPDMSAAVIAHREEERLVVDAVEVGPAETFDPMAVTRGMSASGQESFAALVAAARARQTLPCGCVGECEGHNEQGPA